MSFIEVRFGKSFATGEAIKSCCVTCLSVEQGEFVSIVGPMGSGKSTLLSILAGLTSADAGTVTIDGSPVNGFAVTRRSSSRTIHCCRGSRRSRTSAWPSHAALPEMTAEEQRAGPDASNRWASAMPSIAGRASSQADAAARRHRARVRPGRRCCFWTSRSARSTR